MSDDELKFEMKERFMPMNEKEQKAFLNMLIECYFELCEMKPESENDARVIDVQKNTYIMLINLFNTPARALREIGYDPRKVLLDYCEDDEEGGKA